jgi:hypothetical protein
VVSKIEDMVALSLRLYHHLDEVEMSFSLTAQEALESDYTFIKSS